MARRERRHYENQRPSVSQTRVFIYNVIFFLNFASNKKKASIMVSNKVKRNIWLALSMVSFMCVVSRAINVLDGTSEWWQLLSITMIFVVIFKLYMAYRKQVKAGNLFGKADPFKS